MRNIHLLLVCLMLPVLPIKARDNSGKKIQLTGGDMNKGNAFFISEIHGFYELNDFKFALIAYLQCSAHIGHVIIEAGHANAYLINRYMRGKDIGALNPKTKALMDKWQQLYGQQPFTVHGIDFERMDFVKAVRLILDDNSGAEQTKLYTYISSLEDTAQKIPQDTKGYEARTLFYEQARSRFASEKETLRKIVKTDFDVLESIMENPASEEKMNKRNKSMYTNMQQLNKDMKEGFVCILGGAHNMLKSGQSILSHYLSDNAEQVTLVKMFCKNCYISTYFKSNVYQPLATDPDDNKSKARELEERFDSYYRNDDFIMVNEKTLMPAAAADKPQVSVYYALFKDQPQW